MVNYNLKYVFIFYLENFEELEKIFWNILEEIFIDDNEFDCFDVCYVIYDLILLDEVVYEFKNVFKFFEFENK